MGNPILKALCGAILLGFGMIEPALPQIHIETIELNGADRVDLVFRHDAPVAGRHLVQYRDRLPLESEGNNTWQIHDDARLETGEESQDNLFRFALSGVSSLNRYYRIAFAPFSTSQGRVVINEVMSDNETAIADEDGDFRDWIELKNSGDAKVSLSGLFLTDDLYSKSGWPLPDIELDPGAILTIFASGKDRGNPAATLHADFRLNADGETVALINSDREVLDFMELPSLDADHSVGRNSNEDWEVFPQSHTTPGKPNPDRAGTPLVCPPVFSIQPGKQEEPIETALLKNNQTYEVYFTLDGSIPTRDGNRYTQPLALDETTTIRIAAFDSQGRTSAVYSGTYLFNEPTKLPILSLAAPSENFEIEDGFLYGFGKHMFTRDRVNANFPYSASNAWMDREIECSLEFFESDGERVLHQNVGLKVFGGWGSRGYPQKSFALFARAKYGSGKMRHQMFPDLEVDAFESLVLRNSGNDNQSTHQIAPRPPISDFGPPQSNGSYFVNGRFTLIRDALMAGLAGELGLDTQAYRPLILYLNGEYWGIYNLREKLNEHYLASHHEVDPDEVDLIEGYGTANSGTAEAYNQLRSLMSNPSLLTDPRRYDFISNNLVEVPNFIDYHLCVLYGQNFDIGNIKCWRSRNGGRFRWMLYDQDYGFGLWPSEVYLPAMARDYADYDNMFEFYTNPIGSGTGWPNAGGRTLMLRAMLANDGFRTQFIDRCADLLNTTFRSDAVAGALERLASGIRPEIRRHLDRWSWESLRKRGFGSPYKAEDDPLTQELWEKHLGLVMDFAESRPEKLRRDLMDHFRMEGGLGEIEIDVEPKGSGRVLLNTLDIAKTPWRGVYFVDQPVSLRAEPSPDFRFIGWSSRTIEPGSNEFLSVRIQRDTTLDLQARFQRKVP